MGRVWGWVLYCPCFFFLSSSRVHVRVVCFLIPDGLVGGGFRGGFITHLGRPLMPVFSLTLILCCQPFITGKPSVECMCA